jgi:nucleotide-binding universal stress UspA family protein
VSRLETACHLGQKHGAAVTALYAVTPSFVELPFSPEIGPGIASSLREIDDKQRDRVLAEFGQSQLARSVHATWSEIADAPLTALSAQQALYADLLVLGQNNPAFTSSASVPSDFAETVMAASGKPALILPYVQGPFNLGETVVIAWKPSREVARAVSAALPLLKQARSVHVLSWSRQDETVSGNRLDLNSYLRLHGVQATWHQEGAEPEALGELLLSRVFDLNADLLVMGCYGHSRAREWIVGGTSRTVLQSMTLPVLMAH